MVGQASPVGRAVGPAPCPRRGPRRGACAGWAVALDPRARSGLRYTGAAAGSGLPCGPKSNVNFGIVHGGRPAPARASDITGLADVHVGAANWRASYVSSWLGAVVSTPAVLRLLSGEQQTMGAVMSALPHGTDQFQKTCYDRFWPRLCQKVIQFCCWRKSV